MNLLYVCTLIAFAGYSLAVIFLLWATKGYLGVLCAELTQHRWYLDDMTIKLGLIAKSAVSVEDSELKVILAKQANLYLSSIDTAITDLNDSLKGEDDKVDYEKARLQQRLEQAAQELAEYESNPL